jgi:hypothetical protein
MRRLRPLRRRARQRELEALESQEQPEDDAGNLAADDEESAEIVPFVPVSGEYRSPDDEAEAEDIYGPPLEQRRRVRLPRPHIPRPHPPRPHVPRLAPGTEIRFGVLLAILALIAGGIFGTLVNLGRISGKAQDWWPGAIIAVAVLWMVAALAQRRVASFLGGAALAGVGLSLLMDTQRIASAQETLIGTVLVTVGLGIAIRGLLLRQHTPL